jgi:predicted RNase H-like HicB family nuclease
VSGYSIVIEGSNGSFSAYSPELPGCVATGRSRSETERRMHEAIAFHVDGLRADGDSIPPPVDVPSVRYVETP